VLELITIDNYRLEPVYTIDKDRQWWLIGYRWRARADDVPGMRPFTMRFWLDGEPRLGALGNTPAG
jgi:hypothetical protein